MDNRPEILAPAGSMEALRAAVECGADAVYLGAGSFNARRNARNFSEEELRSATEYCHVRGVKVHQTLNTLVSDDELSEAVRVMEHACACGVDALILQDPGLVAIAREAAPDMELHASTQMAVMTPDGFRELAAMGFHRAVLPRELSFEEILAVREATKDTGLELEMFIHGALCMCVSGQCYLSAMMGGRSGNRGLCAQPCRLPFSATGGKGDHALSLKDLSAVEAIPALFDAGVTSFKIEGRMKRPEYVAAAVTACRNAVDGTPDPELNEALDAVFSRSGHTDGYLTGQRGHGMFGTRRKEDVTAAAPVLKELEQLYRNETRTTPVSMAFTAGKGLPMTLRVSLKDGTLTAFADSSGNYIPEPAQNTGTDPDKVRAQLAKTGGTGFSATPEDIIVDVEDGLFLPASALNALRREALERLKEEIRKSCVKSFDREAAEAVLSAGTAASEQPAARIARLASREQLPGHTPEGLAWLLPLGERLENAPFGVEIPRGLYQCTERVREQLKDAKNNGAQFAYAGTLDGVALAKAAGLPVLGGFTLNGYNRAAREEYRKRGIDRLILSQELTLRQAGGIPGDNGLLVYGRSPLMLTRNRPDGPETGVLTDRKGVTFPVVRNGDAFELLNSVPLYLGDRQEDLPDALTQLFWFTIETAEEVADILSRYETGSTAAGDFTRGLYYKGVL